MRETTIAKETMARVIAGLQASLPGYAVRVTLQWDIHEPYAVAFVFEQGDTTVTYHADRWALREAIANGSIGAMGEGGFSARVGVRGGVWPKQAVLAWDHTDHQARVGIDSDTLSRFLLATTAACPREAEDIDIDGLIAQIVKGTA